MSTAFCCKRQGASCVLLQKAKIVSKEAEKPSIYLTDFARYDNIIIIKNGKRKIENQRVKNRNHADRSRFSSAIVKESSEMSE